MRKKFSRLRITLILRPLLLIFSSVILILIALFTGINDFMNEQAVEAINRRFDQLDAYYDGKTFLDNEIDGIFQTSYMIVDEEWTQHYISHESEDETTIVEALSILTYADENIEEDLDELAIDWDGAEILIDENSYLVSLNVYEGQIEGDHIVRQGDKIVPYYVFTFVNTTPMHRFLSKLTMKLGIVVSLIFALTLILLVFLSRKVAYSFSKLRDYILSVGRREKVLQPQFTYQEFDDIIQTINHMSQLIEQEQNRQQLFFQNASHELRTPLMSIQGYAEGLKEGVIGDVGMATDVIISESQKMTDLVDEILTLSKLENHEETMHLEVISLTDLIYDMCWQLKAQADEKKIRFEHHFSKPHIKIQADELLLERAIKNVLVNAVRYAKQLIRISLEETDEMILLTISNDGDLIEQEELPYIFDRFYKGKDGNFGIGLAITKEIIEQHQAHIKVESDNLNGTRFQLTFPNKEET